MAEEIAVAEAPQVGPQVAGGEGIDPALIERLQGTAPAPAEKPAEEVKKPQTAEDSVRAAMKAVADRARAPDGKFVKAETAPDAAAPADAQISQQPDKPTPPAAIEPPAAAKGLLKSTDWAKLPRAVQDALSKDLAALDGHVPEKVKGDVEFAQQIRSRLAPHEAAMRSAGFNHPAQAIDYLIRMQDWATRDIRGYARMVAQHAGLTIAESAGSQPAPQNAPDPLLQQVVLPKLQALEQHYQQAINSQTDAQIRSFRDQKDAQGQPAHPHFEAVAARMGQLLQSGIAKDMADAYDQAVWADSSLRNRVLEDRQKAETAKRLDEQRRATAEAQRAASPPKGAPGAAPAANANGAKRGERVEDSVRNAIRRVQANA